MATAASVSGNREKELWRCLGEVNDPELDEPITEMGFVERAVMTGDGSVEIDFRLPTYWCSPNFAFLMLDGVRKALDAALMVAGLSRQAARPHVRGRGQLRHGSRQDIRRYFR